MIFSECPNCDEAQAFCWEAGDPGGWFPSKCMACRKVMWVQCTTIGGETITHDQFMRTIAKPGDEEEIERAAVCAPVRSSIVYSDFHRLHAAWLDLCAALKAQARADWAKLRRLLS